MQVHITPPQAQTTVGSGVDPLAGIVEIRHRGNWPVKSVPTQYLLQGQDGILTDLAAGVAARLQGQLELRVGWAAEAAHRGGALRPLRVIRKLRPGHVAAVDLLLSIQGDSLSVSLLPRPWTAITYYRWMMNGALFTLLFTTGFLFYIDNTDQLGMLARDFARKMAVNDNADILFQRFRYGDEISPAWSYLDFFKADPGQVLLDLGRAPAILAGVIGFLLKKLPGDALRWFCMALGSLTPEDFEHESQAHVIAVTSAVNDVLYAQFGLTETDKRYVVRA